MESIPAVVRILMIFALILLAIKRKWMLGNAFLVQSMGEIHLMVPYLTLAFACGFTGGVAFPFAPLFFAFQ